MFSRIARIAAHFAGGKDQVKASSGVGEADPVSAMIPDHSMAQYVGGTAEQFRLVGEQNVRKMRELADLEPADSVLDVGCGIGRIAIALTQHLDGGSYVGFDIVPHGIQWCQEKITPRYPNFTFFVADIHNGLYHPQGKFAASEYRFPFDDGSFDFVCLTSVFTHLMPDDMEHYVQEIARVLKRGGRCYCTAYVISPEARRHLASGNSKRRFVDSGKGYWADNPDDPLHAIGFEEEYLLGVFRRQGLEVVHVAPGEWWTNEYAQDVIVVRKS